MIDFVVNCGHGLMTFMDDIIYAYINFILLYFCQSRIKNLLSLPGWEFVSCYNGDEETDFTVRWRLMVLFRSST